MIINELKLKKQLEEIEKWRKSKLYGARTNGCGIFKHVTGFGKTYETCLLINKYLENKPNAKIGIFVSIADKVKDWKDEVILHCSATENICVETVQYYLHHNKRENYDLLIIDEIHTFYSDERIKFITKEIVGYKHILGLSGTPEDEDGIYGLVVKHYCPIISVITEEEAIMNNWVSDYVELNVPVSLSEFEKIRYEHFSSIITDKLKFFGGDFDLALKCLSGNNKEKISNYQYSLNFAVKNGWKRIDHTSNKESIDLDNQYNPKVVMDNAKTLITTTQQRKKLLNHLIDKSKVTLKLVEKFKGKKIMIFSEDTNFADSIHKQIEEQFTDNSAFKENTFSVLYHSNIKSRKLPSPKTGNLVTFGAKRLKDWTIDQIKTGKSNILVTAKALDAGFNVVDLEAAIITSGTSKYIQHKQRTGRTKRSFEDKHSIIINLYGVDTKEAFSLKKRQSRTNSSKIVWIRQLNEIDKYIN